MAQGKKGPDGSIVYNDGTRRFPNGAVIYKGATVKKANSNSNVRLPDGSIIFSDGSRRYPNKRSSGKFFPKRSTR